jgi:CSLREA domain-containing protein
MRLIRLGPVCTQFRPTWATCLSLPARTACLVGLLVSVNVALATRASAAIEFTVNSTLDGVDDNPGNGICHTIDGTCTLRAAVMEANRAPNAGATILLPASVDPYTLQIFPTPTNGEESGDLNLTSPASGNPVITVKGAGAASTIIDANGIDRVFNVEANRTVAISGLTLRNGDTLGDATTDPSKGGAILSRGNVTLTDCIIRDNTASYQGGAIYNAGLGVLMLSGSVIADGISGPEGGGIYNASGATLTVSHSIVNGSIADSGGGIFSEGMTTVTYSTVSDNHAAYGGGGIYNYTGTINVDHSTISGNSATGSLGGGIFVDASANISQSTISGNSANQGGGIYNEGLTFLTNSTVSLNHSRGDGGGIYTIGNASYPINVLSSTIAFNQADDESNAVGTGGGVYVQATGVFNLRDTIVAGNTHSPLAAVVDDCNGAMGFFSKNKLGSFSGCSFAANGTGTFTVLLSVAQLGPLQDNGGPTQTHALVPPSTMIDGGGVCINQNSVPLTTDQRGRPRFAGTGCDLGAFEYDAGDVFINGFQ